MFDRTEKHPAFGMLAFHRISGGDPNLFGSSVQHYEKLRLTLHEGSVSRGLNNDWYHAGKLLFEVEMSYTQFGELSSAMNVGEGVPVTIRYTKETGAVPELQIVNRKTQFLDEFREANAKSAATAKELIAKLRNIFSEKRAIKASERDQILSMLTQLYNAVNSQNEFILDQFNETMENITAEAKGEIEAFVQSRMNSLAIAALRENGTLEGNPVNPLELPEEDNSKNDE